MFYAVTEAVQGPVYSTMKPEQLQVDARRLAKKRRAILITHGVEWLTTRTIDGPLTGNTRSNTVGRHA